MEREKLIPDAGNEEVINVYIDEVHYPNVFHRKLKELVDDCGMTEDEAREAITSQPFVLELVYHPNYGLFAVESEAIDSTEIFSPYTGEEIYSPYDEED